MSRTSLTDDQKDPGASEICFLRSCETETDLNWLKNQVKVVGEREILASLVKFKHNSMAEMIRNEKEEKKSKAWSRGQGGRTWSHLEHSREGRLHPPLLFQTSRPLVFVLDPKYLNL